MEVGTNLGTVSTATTELLKRQDEDWELQMRNFEEVERWEKIGKQKLPADLKTQYLEYLSNYSGFVRMPVYKMLDTLQWDHTALVEFYGVLTKVPRDTMAPLVALMESFIPYNIVLVCHYLLREFKDYQVEELVMKTDRSDAHLLVQVCRHLPEAELVALVELANRLTLHDIIILLKRCNEPFAKHCALCRTRRLHALEQRMLNEQVPDGLIKVPGTLPLYQKDTTWSADDEKGFTFNVDTAEIFWYKYPVDLIQICDKCLMDVNQAITNSRRFEEIHTIDASKRKGALRNLRDHEKGLAEVIYRLSHERNNRRGREWSLRALEYQRAGLAREERERKANAEAEERKRQQMLKQQEHQRLVDTALTVDRKWIESDQAAEAKRLDKRQAYTEVKQRFEYEYPVRKAPNDRLHARTWHLAPISPSGKALLPEGAAQIFGTYVHPVVNHDPELAAWKAKVDVSHGAYLKKQEDIRKAKRAALEAEIDRLCNHVKERIAEINFHEELALRQKQKEEQDRLKKRAEDRVMRREKRFEEYLQAEREHMVFEDNRSFKLRDYEWQVLHEQSEREDMFNEESEQRAFDRFWGLDLYVQVQNEEEARLRQFYEERVAFLNGLMVATRAVKGSKKHYSVKRVGTLPEDNAFATEQERRDAVIKKLKAEEVRSKLRVRVSYSYS